MKAWKRAAALAPALIAAAGCETIGNTTRDWAGLDESPVRTEYDDGRPAGGLPRAGNDARDNLVSAIRELVGGGSAISAEVQTRRAHAVFARAEEYYHVGRLAMRSQCESFMQTLASVDGQTTFGRDLANNFFDTATVAATISNSPTIWATGLSATQNSFNSISGSTERFLLLTDSVGALRERVVHRMESAESDTPSFAEYKNDDGSLKDSVTSAVALDMARQSVEAVQRYGAPCTEAGLRLIIAEALSTNGIARQAQEARQRSSVEVLESIINTTTVEGQERYVVRTRDLQLMYVWALTAGEEEPEGETGKIRNQIEFELPYLAALRGGDESRVSYYVQQIASERPQLRDAVGAVRAELLAAYQTRTTANTPQAPEQPSE
ncbi:MAG: hypothetical protein K2P58_13430 [Hyphomonadaceae bacterium]|nr:hypothetical protein [Hyphomonadaceae bacterium]